MSKQGDACCWPGTSPVRVSGATVPTLLTLQQPAPRDDAADAATPGCDRTLYMLTARPEQHSIAVTTSGGHRPWFLGVAVGRVAGLGSGEGLCYSRPEVRQRRQRMKKLAAALAVLAAVLVPNVALAAPWTSSVSFSNQVASSPFRAGGYPVPPGQTAPDPGTCRLGDYNANRSESWIAVNPGTGDLVGTSQVFFEKFSTFYDFHLGSYTIPAGTPAANNIVQGYECISTGTQAMPPSWMNNTDPNVDFDTQGRAYQVTLPFNPWWTNHLHPDGAIGVSYSDDLGRTWVTGNGGAYLDRVPNQSSKTLGGVEDKQWVAVNHLPGNRYQDHVYAAWAVFNGSAIKVRLAISRDRGQSFTTPVTLSAPAQVGPAVTYVYPAVDAAGDVYVSVVSFPPSGKPSTIY